MDRDRSHGAPLSRPSTPLAIGASLALLATIASGGCGKPATPPTPPAATATPAPPASEPPTAPAAPKDEVKIMVEKWENGNMKFWNEMRRDANGKWQKNGLGRAYYASGVLEREGMYKDGKRVGKWQFFDQEGKPSMVDERGDGTTPGVR